MSEPAASPSDPASNPSQDTGPEDLAVFEATGVTRQSPLAGRVLADRYEILSELGRGGMGVVYLAADRRDGVQVAVKMLMGSASRSEDMRLRFQREAETASRLHHPGICGVLDFGSFEGLPFLVMHLVQGTTLDAVLEKARAATPILPTIAKDAHAPSPDASDYHRSSAVAVDRMVKLVEKAARALHVAHEMGLIHRDIKPANLMVTPAGDPVLLDFGLARDLSAQGQTLTESGQIVGTPAYLAPEQVRGERAAIDRRTDIYALGVTLYECITLQRPLRGETRDQLFHDILVGNWIPPRKRNPRIPIALATIVEKAMDREAAQRYATAADFADDLRRVGSFEPIRARRLGLIIRLQRWAGRHPRPAAVAAATVIMSIAGLGFALQQSLARAGAVRAKQLEAELLLKDGKFTSALEVLAQARELGLDATADLATKTRIEQARELAAEDDRRSRDLALASAARLESTGLQRRYETGMAALSGLRLSIDRERSLVFMAPVSDEARGRFARLERELRAEEAEADRALRESYEALERAARHESPWGPPSPATREAFASYYLARWREAVAARDDLRAHQFRATVERFDQDGLHANELSGHGTLLLAPVAAGVAAFLFRYEPYESLRSGDPVPRLVPVPTLGSAHQEASEISPGFCCGDPCLAVTAVGPGSIAWNEGLRVGDLLIALAGRPLADRAFVREVTPLAGVSELEVPLYSVVAAVNDNFIESRYDWLTARVPAEDQKDRIRLAGRDGDIVLNRRGVVVSSGRRLIEGAAPSPMTITAIRAGETVSITVPAGELLGVKCEATAYPLIFGAKNRLPTGTPVSCQPGSYLVVFRGDSSETLRIPVVIDRGGKLEVKAAERPLGWTPEGYVMVPAGFFRSGGDPEAVHAAVAEDISVQEFLIAKYEVTNREWFEFINAEETLKVIDASDGRRLLPREQTQSLALKTEDHSGWTWKGGSAETPVLGVSWNDVQEFLTWKNRRAGAEGLPWHFDLPTQEEWEKAARGVDGRWFPWGDRFDFALAVSAHRKAGFLHEAPGGFEPCDESPFGLRDMAGSRQEWTKSRVAASDPEAPPAYHLLGGAWGAAIVNVFRVAGRGYSDANYVGGHTGFRLVLRPRE